LIDNQQVAGSLAEYLRVFPEDAGRLEPIAAGLRSGFDLIDRSGPGDHATASALVLDQGRRVLHLHHNILGIWLWPGGHLDPEDTDLAGAAAREAVEEAGLDPVDLRVLSPVPVHVAVHRYPANAGRGEPDHRHFDFRFAFQVPSAPVVDLCLAEVSASRWLPVAECEPADLADRLVRLGLARAA
jgi:8-oxo-dGTP pyrophosphatase MutT (NUDIX family)